METITSFSGEFSFLSNFAASTISLEGVLTEGGTAPTVEHAFQAAKTLRPEWRARILAAETPGRAKRLGREAPLRLEWEEVVWPDRKFWMQSAGRLRMPGQPMMMKELVMLRLLLEKFTPRSGHARLLLETGAACLIEGNTWNDTFWGVCAGRGQNRLGFLLMEVREGLRD